MTPEPEGSPGPAQPVAIALAVALLAAGTVTWAALPMAGAQPGARPALILAAGCAVASLARLATSLAMPHPGTRVRLWLLIISVPWAQGMTVAVLALEALHRSRPWHTVVLGVVLLGYLFALHLTETEARPAVLRPQVPLIVSGLCLAGLSAGAAMLPASSSGAGWLSVLAAIAAVVVAALALPI